MKNAFLITQEGIVVTVAGRPYSADRSHLNYDQIIQAVKDDNFEVIPGLVNTTQRIATMIAASAVEGSENIVVDVEAATVTYDGEELHGTLVNRILDMCAEGFNTKPMVNFLENLMQNPSKRAVDELYGFLEYGKMSITEDGCFLAYKKIKDNGYDCHSGAVLNLPADKMSPEQYEAALVGIKAHGCTTKIEDGITTVSMPRNRVNEDSGQTCSDGLHFCSHEYLTHFWGDRVVVLKINPRDVVSIPVDYNNTKGRACRYQPIDELTQETMEAAHEGNVFTSPVVTSETDLNATGSYRDGYVQGYTEGKAKTSEYIHVVDDEELTEWEEGYNDGARDGRGHKPKLYK